MKTITARIEYKMHYGLPNSWWYTLVGTGVMLLENMGLGKTMAEARTALVELNGRRAGLGLPIFEVR